MNLYHQKLKQRVGLNVKPEARPHMDLLSHIFLYLMIGSQRMLQPPTNAPFLSIHSFCHIHPLYPKMSKHETVSAQQFLLMSNLKNIEQHVSCNVRVKTKTTEQNFSVDFCRNTAVHWCFCTLASRWCPCAAPRSTALQK